MRRTPLRPRVAAVSLAVLLSALALPGSASAQTAYTGFEENDDYELVVDGRRSESAELFWSANGRAFLLVANELPTPVLVSPATRRVSGVPVTRLAKRANGTVDVLGASDFLDHGGFDFDRGEVSFAIGARAVTMRSRPPLLGWQDPGSLSGYSSLYRRRADAYEPRPEAVADLLAYDGEAELVIYFGSWCPHCQRTVPLAMKLAERLEGSRIAVDFYGLPQRILEDPLAASLQLTGVPTGIVTVNGREVSRLVGDAWASPEVTLRNILRP